MKCHYVVALMLALLLTGCVEQNENPVDPEQAQGPNRSDVSDGALVSVPPATNPTADAPRAELIPGDAEAVYDPPGERIKVYTDFETFDEATGELTVVDFNGLPPYGSSCPQPNGYEDSIPNPMTIGGMIIEDPYCLWTDYCSDPTCPGGRIVLGVHTHATIDLISSTSGVMISVEGAGDDWFSIRAQDSMGSSVSARTRAIPFGTRYLGFTSAVGITRLEVWEHAPGELPLASIYLEHS